MRGNAGMHAELRVEEVGRKAPGHEPLEETECKTPHLGFLGFRTTSEPTVSHYILNSGRCLLNSTCSFLHLPHSSSPLRNAFCQAARDRAVAGSWQWSPTSTSRCDEQLQIGTKADNSVV